MAGQHGHGHTLAAWTGVIIAFVGFCVAGAFMVADQPVGFWAGMGLILLSCVVGGVMKLMGLGTPPQQVQHSASRREESAVSADA